MIWQHFVCREFATDCLLEKQNFIIKAPSEKLFEIVGYGSNDNILRV